MRLFGFGRINFDNLGKQTDPDERMGIAELCTILLNPTGNEDLQQLAQCQLQWYADNGTSGQKEYIMNYFPDVKPTVSEDVGSELDINARAES